MLFAFRKKTQNSFVLLSTETSFVTKKYLYLEITGRILVKPPGLSVAFCWNGIIYSVVQIHSLNLGQMLC